MTYDPFAIDSAQRPHSRDTCVPFLALNAWSNEQHETELLKFNLSVPDGVQLFKSESRAPIPKQPVIDLAYFRDRLKQPNLEILVQASVLQHEVALRDYYKIWSQLAGDEILQHREIGSNADQPDILSRRSFPDGQHWMTRQTGYKVWMGFGAYVVTLNISCNESRYEDDEELIQEILSSFAPVRPPEHALAETTRLWSKRYPFDFASYLPSSWKELHHHEDTMDQMRLVFNHSCKGVSSSGLTVQAVSRNKHPEKSEFLNEVFSTWTEKGLNPAEIKYEAGPMLGELKTLEGVAKFTHLGPEGSSDYEYRFLLAETDECWLIVDLIGLDQQQDFVSWAIRDRALGVFVENFKHAT